jgi:hypothetical protein
MQVSPLRSFNIFSGFKNSHPTWVDATESYDAAYERMKEVAFQKPGTYFVFCTVTKQVVCSIDTRILPEPDEH